MTIRPLALLACSCLLLAGCQTNRTVALAPEISLTELSELPTPEVVQFATVAPLDRLEISVPQDSTLSATYLVDENGFINFPLIGSVESAGHTPNQIATTIRSLLADGYLVSPSVNVIPVDVTPPSISIGGQVKSPGSFPARESLTLLRGINVAGGPTEYAKLDDVLVFREAKGHQYIGVFNLGAIARGNYADPRIFPGDVIMVGDSPARRRLDTFLQIFSVGSSALILVDRLGR